MTPQEVEPRIWKHRRGDKYTVVVGSVITRGVGGPFEFIYDNTGEMFPTIAAAMRSGFRDWDRSDDFNIGVMRGGHLIALLWMAEVVDDDPESLAEISEKAGLP